MNGGMVLSEFQLKPFIKSYIWSRGRWDDAFDYPCDCIRLHLNDAVRKIQEIFTDRWHGVCGNVSLAQLSHLSYSCRFSLLFMNENHL